jgi:hypothetical protein
MCLRTRYFQLANFTADIRQSVRSQHLRLQTGFAPGRHHSQKLQSEGVSDNLHSDSRTVWISAPQLLLYRSAAGYISSSDDACPDLPGLTLVLARLASDIKASCISVA